MSVGQKAFASPGSPDCFAFCGDVSLPSRILLEFEASGLSPLESAEGRHAFFVERVRSALAADFAGQRQTFTILHGARVGVGLALSFYLWSTSWSQIGLEDKAEPLPTESVMALALGSGETPVRRQDVAWRHSDIGRTSRAVFSAFCDAIRSGEDRFSGGPPQIVSLYRRGNAEAIGVIFDGQRCLRGSVLPANDAARAGVEWRNELFERCDPQTMQRLPSAQPHARPKQVAG